MLRRGSEVVSDGRPVSRVSELGTVAIVGAGPGGLVAARYLLLHGFEVVVFEQSNRVGGQWNQGAAHSGVWPAMLTNTSRLTTYFSDQPWPQGAPTFPHNAQVREYLEQFAYRFGIAPRIKLGHRVDAIERDGDVWMVASVDADGTASTRAFSHVVVASGRYHLPEIPNVPGLDTFSGSHGVGHTFSYRGPDAYRGQRILVMGCSISSVEIASELAMSGAARVVSSYRRQRYVLQRIIAGMPLDAIAFTRFRVLAGETFPIEVVKAGLKEFIVRTSGEPQFWGARRADDDPFVAGITQSQYYLPLVCEGRITTKPWVRSVDGRTVTFEDGTSEDFDGILFGTGFTLDLPSLGQTIRDALGTDADALRLYHHTFHPNLPNLAFAGSFHQGGPYFPPLELQVRWISYVWSGLRPQPTSDEMRIAMASHATDANTLMRMSEMCLLFSRLAGVEPDVEQWPELKRALLFGPLTPSSFRLSGPDALPDAPLRFAAEAAEFGMITSPELTESEQEMLRALLAARASAER